jgi:GntR family transcriptional repressor for pyruvate dehydrogenase complex
MKMSRYAKENVRREKARPIETNMATTHESQMPIHVANFIRAQIIEGVLKPGDRIPSEREFSKMLKISRPTLRTGLGYLTAVGVMKVRKGIGTFVAEGPEEIGKASLAWLGALHEFNMEDLCEARKLLELKLTELAATRAGEEHLRLLAEELAGMYATIDEPESFLLHNVCFHQAIAQAAGNSVLAVFMGMISAMFYKKRCETVEFVPDRKRLIDEYREIYRAIRAMRPQEARAAMERHLISLKGEQSVRSFRGIESLSISNASIESLSKTETQAVGL